MQEALKNVRRIAMAAALGAVAYNQLPSESVNYLPTANSAIAMQAVGAASGMKATGWRNAQLQKEVDELESRVSDKNKALFDDLRQTAYEDAAAGNWNEDALWQYVDVAKVSTSSILFLGDGVLNADTAKNLTQAKSDLFAIYKDHSPYAGVAMLTMSDMTRQLKNGMEREGLDTLIAADPTVAQSAKFQYAVECIVETILIDDASPVMIAGRMQDAQQIELQTPFDPFAQGMTSDLDEPSPL